MRAASSPSRPPEADGPERQAPRDPRLAAAARPRARQRAVSWLPALAWAAGIFWLSAQPDLRFEQDALLDFVVRKVGHMGVFGTLALLLWWPLARATPLRPAPGWAAALAIFYAGTDELHQGFTAGRHPALTDVGIDTLGIAAAIVAGLAVLVWRDQRAASA